jgi:uncharacterized protein (DUF2336 family)
VYVHGDTTAACGIRNTKNRIHVATLFAIDELQAAIRAQSQERCAELLRQIADLFVGCAASLNDAQVDLFSAVLGLLSEQTAARNLAELSSKLAPVDNAPKAVIRRLADHQDIAVAGPVIVRAKQLSDLELIQIANTKDQNHLRAISERQYLPAAVTDVLLERGDKDIIGILARNRSTCFSDDGFRILAKHAQTDECLAETIGRRADVPARVVEWLVAGATEVVRDRLRATASPGNRAVIEQTLFRSQRQRIGGRV